MTPDRWMVCAITSDEEMQFVVVWRRPLRKVNTGLDSPDVLR